MKQMKIYRKQKGMNQTELAEAVGISQSEISAYESGVKSPRVIENSNRRTRKRK